MAETIVSTPPAELTGQKELPGQIFAYLIWSVAAAPAVHHGIRTWRRWRARTTDTPLVLGGFWRTLVRSPIAVVPFAMAMALGTVLSALGRL